ncbi:hypothetical protein KPL37_09730 [Clostridium frigoris]|uniref:Uncharacterized protein n=1 Tax=Clostridium frigoris TaxID=205327 RepID=A0ABS6BSY9_9CLOT|nr:hypothetical protein [Clostridium frigoris]MBU3160031.1 hypothetical protein [Clostridium frigoris]
MSNYYFLKYYDKTVAEIDIDNKTMEIINLDLFFDKINKNIMSSVELNKWIMNRIRPVSQVGFNSFLTSLALKEDEEDLYFKVFVATRGINVKDKLWLAFYEDESYEECSPWASIIIDDGKVINHSFDLINLNATKTKLNIDGACNKDLARIKGNLCVVKERLQNNSYDNISEELVYEISKRLGIECSPAGVLPNGLCFSVIDETKDLIPANSLIGLDQGSFEDFYKIFLKIPSPRKTKLDVLKMGIFDVITRQMDRNYTNFSFYKSNGILQLYRLYDNGLSLFASSRYRENLDCSLGYGETLESKLKFIVRELKRLNVEFVFYDRVSKDFLEKISQSYLEYIEATNGNKFINVIEWVLKQQMQVEKMLNMYEIKLTE